MAQVEPEALANQELTRVFMAATLAEAKRADEVLTARGVDFVVSVEPLGRTLFGSPRNYAVVSVASGQAEHCGSLLVAEGLGLGVLTISE